MITQLFILSEIGGLVIPANSLVISPLQPLQYYEAVMYWPEVEGITGADMVMGGHKGARLWQMAINMYLERGMEGGHPVREVVRRFPEVVTMLGEKETEDVGLEMSRGGQVKIGGREAWTLLMGREGRGMRELYKYSLVIRDREEMDTLDRRMGDTLDRGLLDTLGEKKDNLEVILRRAWFAR